MYGIMIIVLFEVKRVGGRLPGHRDVLHTIDHPIIPWLGALLRLASTILVYLL